MKTQRVLIIQHTKTSPPGTSHRWIKSRNLKFETYWPTELKVWPNLDQFEMIIVCGGEMNVDEEKSYPWLIQEKKFLIEAIAQNKKIVGLCLGAQLLAEVLGAQVKRHHAWEVGWQDVQLVNGQNLKVFEYHAYSFSLPKGAQQIATNTQCNEQAFQYGKNILGCQFHPEVSQEMAENFARDPELPTIGFSQTQDEILAETPLYQPSLEKWYFKALDRIACLSTTQD